jgi:hypothetical protein
MAYRITRELHYLRIELFGTITRGDLEMIAQELAALEGTLEVTPHRLTEVQGVIGREIGFPEVLALAERRRAVRLRNPVKSAIVAAQPVSVGYARMIQTLHNHPQVEVQIFSTLEVAEAWLMEDQAAAL